MPEITSTIISHPNCLFSSSSQYDASIHLATGILYKAVPRLRECCRQVEAEEVSNSRNKIHQTWEWPYRDSLYTVCGGHLRSREALGARSILWSEDLWLDANIQEPETHKKEIREGLTFRMGLSCECDV